MAVGPEAPTSLRDRLLVTLVLWWDQLDLPPGLAEARLYAPTHWRGQIEPFLSYLRIPLIRLSLIPTGGYSRDSEPGGEGVGSGLMPARTILPTLATLPPILQHLQHRYPALDLQPRMGNWELSYRGFSLVWSESGGPLRIYPGRPVIDEEQADRVPGTATTPSDLGPLLSSQKTFPLLCFQPRALVGEPRHPQPAQPDTQLEGPDLLSSTDLHRWPAKDPGSRYP